MDQGFYEELDKEIMSKFENISICPVCAVLPCSFNEFQNAVYCRNGHNWRVEAKTGNRVYCHEFIYEYIGQRWEVIAKPPNIPATEVEPITLSFGPVEIFPGQSEIIWAQPPYLFRGEEIYNYGDSEGLFIDLLLVSA